MKQKVISSRLPASASREDKAARTMALRAELFALSDRGFFSKQVHSACTFHGQSCPVLAAGSDERLRVLVATSMCSPWTCLAGRQGTAIMQWRAILCL